jgi:hypothetical protein
MPVRVSGATFYSGTGFIEFLQSTQTTSAILFNDALSSGTGTTPTVITNVFDVAGATPADIRANSNVAGKVLVNSGTPDVSINAAGYVLKKNEGVLINHSTGGSAAIENNVYTKVYCTDTSPLNFRKPFFSMNFIGGNQAAYIGDVTGPFAAAVNACGIYGKKFQIENGGIIDTNTNTFLDFLPGTHAGTGINLLGGSVNPAYTANLYN